MLNHRFIKHELPMHPGGSLNSLAINNLLLAPNDPLLHRPNLTGKDIVSRQAFIELLNQLNHPCQHSLRDFLTHFNADNPADHEVLTLYGTRFSAVIKTAKTGDNWKSESKFQIALKKHWQGIELLTISGGLTSHQFGIALAEFVERQFHSLDVISSPWGGTTALFGLAQTIALNENVLVMDFGSTGIKRGIAHKFGNRIELLPELRVTPHKQNGLIRKQGFLDILRITRQELDKPMQVAISVACYLNEGHPVDYYSGIYHRLGEDSKHLATDLHEQWLPDTGYQGLALLEHDSTAAALAFQLKKPAMMVTLGTGLGSAPCPKI
jgi:hypothetical protein